MALNPKQKIDFNAQQKHDAAIKYIRAKIDQLLTLMGTLPLRPEELDDDTLIELDPIGIVADSFKQVLANLKQTNHELTIARNEIRSVFDSFGAAVIVVNQHDIIDDCNRQAAEWLFHNNDPAEIIGHPLIEVCPCHKFFSEASLGLSKRDTEFNYENRSYQLVKSAIYNEARTLEKSVFMCFDITAQKQAEEILTTLASTDELTGIANRRQFDRILKTEIQRAQRYNIPLSVIMLDIDHFKKVNDEYGHQAGDEVLTSLTKLISGLIRGQDTFARWGGEEFVIMSPNHDIQGMQQFAEKLRLAVEAYTFPHRPHSSCSFGVAQYLPNESIDSFFNRTDKALYKAKENGRNRVEISG
jgi:diguanylate cyclase (GGDEF)-like protein